MSCRQRFDSVVTGRTVTHCCSYSASHLVQSGVRGRWRTGHGGCDNGDPGDGAVPRPVSHLVRQEKGRLTVFGDAGFALERWELSGAAAAVFSHVDGRRTVAEICRLSTAAGIAEARDVLVALVRSGVLCLRSSDQEGEYQ